MNKTETVSAETALNNAIAWTEQWAGQTTGSPVDAKVWALISIAASLAEIAKKG
jgi:hypothetical protein